MRLPSVSSLRSKKRLLIICGGLGVLLIAGYIVWSQYTWGQFTPTYTAWHQGVKDDIGKIIALPTTNVKEQDAVATRLVELSSKIDAEHQAVCVVTPIVQWQQEVIPAFNDARMACKKQVASIAEFQKRLTTVIAYSKDDQALTKIIASVPQVSELADDTWEKQVVAWDIAIKSTEKRVIADDFKPTQQLALKQMNAVKSAWQEIISAHQAKDKQKYLAAQTTLASAIDGFSEVATTSQRTFAKLSNELEVAVRSVRTP
ncbi:MAG: hypothetical protein JWM07_793 [Candidatus Saccharibacteria bacterium]|nr:hypothetical protein [Candidatus Saccharibacteria bacterium]